MVFLKVGPATEKEEVCVMEDIHAHLLKRIALTAKTVSRLRVYHCVIFAATYILIFAFIVTICIYLYAGNLIYSLLDDTPTDGLQQTAFTGENFNINEAIRSAFEKTISFLQTSATSGNVTTIYFVNSAIGIVNVSTFQGNRASCIC